MTGTTEPLFLDHCCWDLERFSGAGLGFCNRCKELGFPAGRHLKGIALHRDIGSYHPAPQILGELG